MDASPQVAAAPSQRRRTAALVAFGAVVLALETAATIFWGTRFPFADAALGAVLFVVPSLFVADLARRGIMERGAVGGVPLLFAVVVALLVPQVVAHAQAAHPNFLRAVSWPVTQYLAGALGWVVMICTALVLVTAVIDVFVMLVAWVMADALDFAAVPLSLIVGAIVGLAVGHVLCSIVAQGWRASRRAPPYAS